MRRLSDQERKKVTSALEPIILQKQVSGICVYGSQVAGYARPESDYDVIIALNPFRQKIKYYYLSGGEVDCSALVVDSNSFERDCSASSYGEFVAGRLLNPIDPVEGEVFFSKNEVAYKRRVILEGLIDAFAENEDFASELRFHLPYFLFEKLKKRAAIYPPVVYSYSQTYGEKLLKENLEASIAGFRRGAEQLEKEDLISFSEDIVKIGQRRFRGGASARLYSAASYTTKSIRQYAVHGYAGRVGPIVVGKEVVSKLSRSRNHSKLPDVIHSPESYLSISEGKLFADSEDWMTDLMEYLHVEQREAMVNQKRMGEMYTTSSVYTLGAGENKCTVAVKRFKDIKGMKWGILNLWSLRSAGFVAGPLARLHREYWGMREFRKMGLHTPEPIAVFLAQRILVCKFIEGKDLSKLQSEFLNGENSELHPFEEFGRALSVIHNAGYCMGDTKPSNAILCGSEIYLADLEQSHPGGDPVWDIAEFIYYSVRFTTKEQKARQLVSAFLRGYLDNASSSSVLEKATTLRYRAPFQAFIAPNVLSGVLKDVKVAATLAS
ncbi:MAG: hypothetical protein ACYC7D_02495 [Nitrososphaerales archaeon]